MHSSTVINALTGANMTLTISDLDKKKHSGKYGCKVTNDYESNENSVDIIIVGKLFLKNYECA